MSKISGPARARARLQNRLLQRVRRHGNLTALYGRAENGRHQPTAPALPAPLPDVPLVRAILVAGHPYQGMTAPEAETPVLVVEVPEEALATQATPPQPEAPETAAPPPPEPPPAEAPPVAEQAPPATPVDAAPSPAAASPPVADEDEGPPAGDLSSAEDSWRRLQRIWRKQEEKRASGVPPKVELEAPWLRRLFE